MSAGNQLFPTQAAAQNAQSGALGAGTILTGVGTVGGIGISSIFDNQLNVLPKDDVVFRGGVEVRRVSNGYIVSVSTNRGGLPTVYIAQTIAEVNELLTAEMVKFQLEK